MFTVHFRAINNKQLPQLYCHGANTDFKNTFGFSRFSFFSTNKSEKKKCVHGWLNQENEYKSSRSQRSRRLRGKQPRKKGKQHCISEGYLPPPPPPAGSNNQFFMEGRKIVTEVKLDNALPATVCAAQRGEREKEKEREIAFIK